ncbi:hypothetical protein D9M68_932020 [compost metagenome]
MPVHQLAGSILSILWEKAESGKRNATNREVIFFISVKVELDQPNYRRIREQAFAKKIRGATFKGDP